MAWLGYGVDLPGHVVGWTLTTAAVAICASGLALALVAACQNRRQAMNISNVAILIVSAIGGSMVPRFFMPPLMQSLGWLTPNTWGLEAYASVFWREAPAVGAQRAAAVADGGRAAGASRLRRRLGPSLGGDLSAAWFALRRAFKRSGSPAKRKPKDTAPSFVMQR